MAAPVRLVEIDDGPDRHHLARIHFLLAAVVVLLDVPDIDRSRYARDLIQLARIRP